MGQLHVYCAGANIRDIPGKKVGSILLNVVDNFATESLTKEADRILKLAKPERSMLDNGGYPLLKAEEKGKRITHYRTKPIKDNGTLNLTPHHVLEIVRKIRPDDFIALDFPVRKLSKPSMQQAEFKRKKKYNGPWAFECAELRESYCPEVGMLVSIQCYDEDQLEDFLKAIDGISLDGFSMPVRHMNLSEIARVMTRFHQLGISRIHLLGVTEFFTLALSAFMARHFFNCISLDSRTWKIRATFGTYLNPHDLIGEDITDDVFIDEKIIMDCSCPWCRDLRFNYIKHLPYYDKRIFLGCHNWWVTEKAAADLYQNSGSVSELERYLMFHCRRTDKINELTNALNLVESLV